MTARDMRTNRKEEEKEEKLIIVMVGVVGS